MELRERKSSVVYNEGDLSRAASFLDVEDERKSEDASSVSSVVESMSENEEEGQSIESNEENSDEEVSPPLRRSSRKRTFHPVHNENKRRKSNSNRNVGKIQKRRILSSSEDGNDISSRPSSAEESSVECILDVRDTEDASKEYYVKFRGRSYLHLEWIREEEMTKLAFAGCLRRYSNSRSGEKEEVEDLFDKKFIIPSYILDERKTRYGKEFLIKWTGLSIAESTWEDVETEGLEIPKEVMEFFYKDANSRTSIPRIPSRRTFKPLEESPVYRYGNEMFSYQVEGLNFLLYNWICGRNSILADEMGLGKTIQAIAFLEKLFEYGFQGPFLVIAPLSTIINWQREFNEWSEMSVIIYHGRAVEREMTAKYLFHRSNVVVTTYEMAMCAKSALKKMEWDYMVVDEGHRLKNRSSKMYDTLSDFHTHGKMILTGTPIQNNVEELWNLLHFLEPLKFNREAQELCSAEDVKELHSAIRPFILRRLKHDVEKSIPKKEEIVVEVELTRAQKEVYKAILTRNKQFLVSKSTKRLPQLTNIMIQLRKVCNHPYLVDGIEEKLCLDEKRDLVLHSGKMIILDKLLRKLKEQGQKVLVFSQLTMMLDVIEDFLKLHDYNFCRIDGNVKGTDRQQFIDLFQSEGSDVFVFLLSTRAGGLGINLTASNTVILFDSDWNPQNDIQACSRAHRIGQKKDVKVYRFITKNTYESRMFEIASRKLGLEQAILSNVSSGVQDFSPDELDRLLRHGVYDLFEDEGKHQVPFSERDIDEILKNNSKVIQLGLLQESNTFSKASFVMKEAEEDQEFWKKLLPMDETTPDSVIQRYYGYMDKNLLISQEEKGKFLKTLTDCVNKTVERREAGEQAAFRDVDQLRSLLTTIRSTLDQSEPENANPVETTEHSVVLFDKSQSASIDDMFNRLSLAKKRKATLNSRRSKENDDANDDVEDEDFVPEQLPEQPEEYNGIVPEQKMKRVKSVKRMEGYGDFSSKQLMDMRKAIFDCGVYRGRTMESNLSTEVLYEEMRRRGCLNLMSKAEALSLAEMVVWSVLSSMFTKKRVLSVPFFDQKYSAIMSGAKDYSSEPIFSIAKDAVSPMESIELRVNKDKTEGEEVIFSIIHMPSKIGKDDGIGCCRLFRSISGTSVLLGVNGVYIVRCLCRSKKLQHETFLKVRDVHIAWKQTSYTHIRNLERRLQLYHDIRSAYEVIEAVSANRIDGITKDDIVYRVSIAEESMIRLVCKNGLGSYEERLWPQLRQYFNRDKATQPGQLLQRLVVPAKRLVRLAFKEDTSLEEEEKKPWTAKDVGILKSELLVRGDVFLKQKDPYPPPSPTAIDLLQRRGVENVENMASRLESTSRKVARRIGLVDMMSRRLFAFLLSSEGRQKLLRWFSIMSSLPNTISGSRGLPSSWSCGSSDIKLLEAVKMVGFEPTNLKFMNIMKEILPLPIPLPVVITRCECLLKVFRKYSRNNMGAIPINPTSASSSMKRKLDGSSVALVQKRAKKRRKTVQGILHTIDECLVGVRKTLEGRLQSPRTQEAPNVNPNTTSQPSPPETSKSSQSETLHKYFDQPTSSGWMSSSAKRQ